MLVAHLPQLEQAVQGAYGTTFDAHIYLEKFYQMRVNLPEDRDQPGKHRSAYIAYLWGALGITFSEARHGELVQRSLQALADIHNISLRRLERVMTHVALVCAAAGPHHPIIPPLVAGLCVMRQTHPALYRKARLKRLTWEEAHDFFQPTPGQGIRDVWTLGWWKYATGGEISDDELREYAQSLVMHNVDDRESLIPLMAGYIDDFEQQRDLPEDQ